MEVYKEFDHLSAPEIRLLINYLAKLEQEKLAPVVTRLGIVTENLYYTNGDPNIPHAFVSRQELKERFKSIKPSVKKDSEARCWSYSPEQWCAVGGFMIDKKYVKEIVIQDRRIE